VSVTGPVGDDEPLVFLTEEEPELERPKTRGDCANGPRPCPWVTCRHHNLIEVSSVGTILLRGKRSLPRKATKQMIERFYDEALFELGRGATCSLDFADQGRQVMETVGEALQISRERVRQVEERALHRLSEHKELKRFR